MPSTSSGPPSATDTWPLPTATSGARGTEGRRRGGERANGKQGSWPRGCGGQRKGVEKNERSERPNPNLQSQACPDDGCHVTLGPDKPLFEAHVRDRHGSRKCLWCDEVLSAWWTEGQRNEHRQKHRDRRRFSGDAERLYHDRNCAPDALHGTRCSFCTRCSDYHWRSPDAVLSGRCHGGPFPCGHDGAGGEPTRFCARCGFDLVQLLPGCLQAHEKSCRGYGSQPGCFCPRCGIQFWHGHAQADWEHNNRHMDKCEAKGARGCCRNPWPR